MRHLPTTAPEHSVFRLVGDWVSPAGTRAKLTILIYHRTLAAPDPILHEEIDAAAFRRHMTLLSTEFNVMTLGEACARLARGTMPSRAVCVTFDDGYADNEQIALPILKSLGLRATFFVSTGYSDGGIMFNDGVIEAMRRAPTGRYDLSSLGFGQYEVGDSESRRAAIDNVITCVKYRPVAERHALVLELAAAMKVALPQNLMMSTAQIRRLHDDGMEIGAHTVTHPILARLDASEASREIIDGKQRLEDIVGAPVSVFAYPNGKPGCDYGAREVGLVKKAGFAAAVATIRGVADCRTDMFQLPRFGPWDRDPRRLGARLLLNCVRSPFI